jgi:hypothetical protein
MNPLMKSRLLNASKVRLSDSAVLAGAVSLLYALALMVCPRAFPELLERIFWSGRFFPALAVLLVATNEILFVLICRRRAQTVGLITPGYIAFVTMGILSLLRLLVYGAHAQALYSQFLVRVPGGVHEGIGSEDLLIYTHLAMVSGIFLPYLVLRVTQNYVSNEHSPDQDVKASNAAAGR